MLRSAWKFILCYWSLKILRSLREFYRSWNVKWPATTKRRGISFIVSRADYLLGNFTSHKKNIITRCNLVIRRVVGGKMLYELF